MRDFPGELTDFTSARSANSGPSQTRFPLKCVMADVLACVPKRGLDAVLVAVTGIRTIASQRKAASATSGALSNIFKSAVAAPVGLRLPCSQLRMVSSDTPIRSANSV